MALFNPPVTLKKVALERLHLAASHEELAAVLLGGARDLLPVLLEPGWIGDLVVDDGYAGVKTRRSCTVYQRRVARSPGAIAASSGPGRVARCS
jgi:hypothetical protein